MSLPVITLTPSSKTSISNPPETIKGSREPSFSSYLDVAEETFVLKLGAATTQALGSSLPTSHDHILLRRKPDDREIDVFDAQKYFNDGLHHNSPKVRTKSLSDHPHKTDDPIEIFAIKEQPPTAALSIRSESSWNSRSALLHTISRNQQPRKANKNSFLAAIGCSCSCIDNKSADIDERVGENSSIKSVNTGLVNGKSRNTQTDYNCVKSNGHFSFPVIKNQPARKLLLEKDDAESKIAENGNKNCLNMEKKLMMMTWEALAPSTLAEEITIPSISSEMHNESDSDASSDLFEIESFSKGNSFLSRQTSDAYAPSEASIEWSVVTASAADFSILSDYEEVTSNIKIPCPKKVNANPKIGSLKDIPKLRPSILSGCKSHKAVSVAGDAHRGRRHSMESFTPTARTRDESKLIIGAKNRQRSFDARLVSQSRPASAAHMLYT